MKRHILLVYSIVMYAATIALLILIPTVADQPLDRTQISLLIIMGVLGLSAASLALFHYKENEHDVR